MSDLDKIKERIANLANKTVENGCSEAEAMAAINMVSKLLTSYGISMDECHIRQEVCETLVIDTGKGQAGPISWVLTAIQKLTDTKAWSSKQYRGDISYQFFGQKADTQMAKFLYDVILSAMVTETNKFKSTNTYLLSRSRKGATRDFGIGMADRISKRLNEMNNQRQAEMLRERGGSNSLVVLKDQIVNQAFRELDLNLRSSSRSVSLGNRDAFGAGQSAGDRVNLNRPVGAGATTSGYLV